jgi:tetratricopeptide (TPR) repeat protein
MIWLETEPRRPVRPEVKLALLERAVAADPSPANLAALGALHRAHMAWDEAAAAYEAAARADPTEFGEWSNLADSYLQLGRLSEALDACDRGARLLGPDALAYRRGLVLHGMGDIAGARAELERALAAGIPARGPLNPLLHILARQQDGTELLEFCDALPADVRDRVLVRAFRAIAYSRLGRADDARMLVDLDAYIVRLPFEPPEGIETFNAALAREILADPPALPSAEGFAINYAPRTGDRPAMLALTGFIRTAIEDYLASRETRGMEAALPSPPAAGRLSLATNVLSHEGTNGEHIHPAGYVSAVYHVRAPADGREDGGDDRGGLLVGGVAGTTGGHAACWGVRALRPEPGMLTLMPSHFFHDVAPTRSAQPRISVACDLRPVEQTA